MAGMWKIDARYFNHAHVDVREPPWPVSGKSMEDLLPTTA